MLGTSTTITYLATSWHSSLPQDLNRLPDAEAAYVAALAAFEQLGDRAGQALAHWGLGRLHDSRYDMAAAVRHLDDALRLWPSEREDAGLARAGRTSRYCS